MELMDKQNAPLSKIITGQKGGKIDKNGNSLEKYYLTTQEKRRIKENFESNYDPTTILIVVDSRLA
jgi:hypothetical protein